MGWLSGMFGPAYLVDAWIGGGAAALAVSLVGYFAVVRRAAFAAHVLPEATFAGAAGAMLVGANALVGGALFAVLAAGGISTLGARRSDSAAIALILSFSLGLGGLFVTVGGAYAPQVFALLFGQIVGISSAQVGGALLLLVAVCVGIGFLYRPLWLTSVSGRLAGAKGVPVRWVDVLFLCLMALASAVAVPVVGALLCFGLMVGPAAAAMHVAKSPAGGLALTGGLSLGCMWTSLLLSAATSYPVGFFVTSLCALLYLVLGMRWGRPAVR